MGHLTDRAMREIAGVLKKKHNAEARFYKVNWIIVSTSHDIYDAHGGRGHETRQHIRKRLWRLAQTKYPDLRIYVIPREISGDSSCQIKRISWIKKILYKIKGFFRRLSKKFS